MRYFNNGFFNRQNHCSKYLIVSQVKSNHSWDKIVQIGSGTIFLSSKHLGFSKISFMELKSKDVRREFVDFMDQLSRVFDIEHPKLLTEKRELTGEDFEALIERLIY